MSVGTQKHVCAVAILIPLVEDRETTRFFFHQACTLP